MKSRFLTVRDDCLTEVTLPSGSSEVTFVQVQVLLPAPKQKAVRKSVPFFCLAGIKKQDLNGSGSE